MFFIYNLISTFFLIISPIIVIYRIAIGKEDKIRFLERYAISSKKRKKGKLVWFHCSSVGELLSIIPIIEKLELNTKIDQVLITTTTLSSSKIFEKFKFKKSLHQFFPIDNKFILNRFLSYWKPAALLLCESEIWPNLICSTKNRKIKLILINARITKKSFKRWRLLKHFSKKIFKKFDVCFSQNTETKARLVKLGATNTKNLGNLKFTTSKNIKYDILDNKIRSFFKRKKILITGASTHFNEENFVIQSHLHFQKTSKNIISIIIPRHIERVSEITKELNKFSLKYHTHSNQNKINDKIDIYIVDTYGELNKFYRISDLVFMGGSLIKHGGQNPLEPAKHGCRIIHGPNIDNFKEIYNKLNDMKISTKFHSYKNGIKTIDNKLKNKKSNFDNKKIINYGQKILKSTYTEIIKLI